MINKALSEVLAIPAEAVIGHTIIDLHPEMEGTPAHKSKLKALKGEVIHKDKHLSYYAPELYVDSYYVRYGNKNKPDGIIIMSRDVTQIHKVGMELERKNAELNRSNESLEQFAFVASHDLKEPIRKIKIFASLLINGHEKMLDGKRLQYIQKINSSAGRMIDMVDGLLEYSSLDKVSEKMQLVDLQTVVYNIVSDLELTIQEKQAKIKYDALATVYGVTNLLYQLFLNLIKNSLKFAQPDKAPVIKITATVFKEGKKDFVKVSIKDNGIGFDQVDADKIFGRFVCLHSKSKYEGTGLGLAICDRIVDYHKGTISVKSKLKKGTEFIVVLPQLMDV